LWNCDFGLEVVHEEVPGKPLPYSLSGGGHGGVCGVATTRPETMLGMLAVAVNAKMKATNISITKMLHLR